MNLLCFFFFFQAEDGIRDFHVTGVQTCALPIWPRKLASETGRPDWSVSVKPGAAATGTGDSCIRPASLVLTLDGMPAGRSGWFPLRVPSRVTAKANTV